MKAFKIYYARQDSMPKEKFLVIGVKGKRSEYGEPNPYDLDAFLKKFPDLVVVNRLPETTNPKYPKEAKYHILQPAIVCLKEYL